MSNRRRNQGLQALHRALTAPQTQHLDEVQLSELATAEAAGEALETRYPQETAHLENCVACAQAYTELLELTLNVFQGMAAAAEAVTPREVYTALLTQELRARLGDFTELSNLAHELALELPRHFSHPPTEAELTEKLLQNLPGHPVISPARLANLLRDNLHALALYLQGTANTLWGTPVRLAAESLQSWVSLTLALTPQPVVPVLGEMKTTGDDWPLAGTRAGQPIPLNVTLRAHRLSPLACRVEVILDRPGLADPSGRGVELRYTDQTLIAQTDSTGRVQFEPIPIAVLPELEIRFQA